MLVGWVELEMQGILFYTFKAGSVQVGSIADSAQPTCTCIVVRC